jgi:ATP-dependent DNA ligase
VNPDFDFARKSTATPRNPAKSNTGFRPLLPAAQALSEFFTIDELCSGVAGFVVPAAPIERDRPPTEPDWVREVKHDGYRMIVRNCNKRQATTLSLGGST